MIALPVQADAPAASRVMLLELSLRQIREKVSELSQEEVAQLLEVTQTYISKLERQQDILVSKLYDYVATLGGQVDTVMQVKNQRTIPGPRKTRRKDEVTSKPVARAAQPATARGRGTSRRTRLPKRP